MQSTENMVKIGLKVNPYAVGVNDDQSNEVNMSITTASITFLFEPEKKF